MLGLKPQIALYSETGIAIIALIYTLAVMMTHQDASRLYRNCVIQESVI